MKQVKIKREDGSIFDAELTEIEYEGTDGGYPVYTATLKGSDGKTYYAGLNHECECKAPVEYTMEDAWDDEWVYPVF